MAGLSQWTPEMAKWPSPEVVAGAGEKTLFALHPLVENEDAVEGGAVKHGRAVVGQGSPRWASMTLWWTVQPKPQPTVQLQIRRKARMRPGADESEVTRDQGAAGGVRGVTARAEAVATVVASFFGQPLA